MDESEVLIEDINLKVDYDYLIEFFKKQKEEEKKSKTQNKVDQILNSNIDFSKNGWVEQASKILCMTPQKVGQWMNRNMEDFYKEKCFKRKSTKSNL